MLLEVVRDSCGARSRIRSWLKESSAQKWPMVVRYIRLPSSWSRVTGKNEERGEFLLKSGRTDENVADLMTKHLAAARVEELLSKFGVRRCTRRLMVASLVTRVGADHLDGRTDRVAAMSLAHEVAHGRCV